jgi:LAO/AO transport system kinase
MTDVERILAGDLRAMARAATGVENRTPAAEALLASLFPHTGKAAIVGITGPPGAGKSTLVDQLTRRLRSQDKTVGIIAVDPSSPFTGGAILGDRIRMQSHHADTGVFIRSMATRGRMGGVAAGTLEMALLMDAAGRDVVLVETVGVGQDEIEIARLADVTAVVLVPGMGDDIQAIKAGLMEIADVYVINKADQPGADRLELELKAMLQISPRRNGLEVPIVKTVASEGQGIDEVLDTLFSLRAAKTPDNASLWRLRLREMIRDRLLDRLPLTELDDAAAEVAARRQNPYTVVEQWLKKCGFA